MKRIVSLLLASTMLMSSVSYAGINPTSIEESSSRDNIYKLIDKKVSEGERAGVIGAFAWASIDGQTYSTSLQEIRRTHRGGKFSDTFSSIIMEDVMDDRFEMALAEAATRSDELQEAFMQAVVEGADPEELKELKEQVRVWKAMANAESMKHMQTMMTLNDVRAAALAYQQTYTKTQADVDAARAAGVASVTQADLGTYTANGTYTVTMSNGNTFDVTINVIAGADTTPFNQSDIDAAVETALTYAGTAYANSTAIFNAGFESGKSTWLGKIKLTTDQSYTDVDGNAVSLPVGTVLTEAQIDGHIDAYGAARYAAGVASVNNATLTLNNDGSYTMVLENNVSITSTVSNSYDAGVTAGTAGVTLSGDTTATENGSVVITASNGVTHTLTVNVPSDIPTGHSTYLTSDGHYTTAQYNAGVNGVTGTQADITSNGDVTITLSNNNTIEFNVNVASSGSSAWNSGVVADLSSGFNKTATVTNHYANGILSTTQGNAVAYSSVPYNTPFTVGVNTSIHNGPSFQTGRVYTRTGPPNQQPGSVSADEWFYADITDTLDANTSLSSSLAVVNNDVYYKNGSNWTSLVDAMADSNVLNSLTSDTTLQAVFEDLRAEMVELKVAAITHAEELSTSYNGGVNSATGWQDILNYQNNDNGVKIVTVQQETGLTGSNSFTITNGASLDNHHNRMFPNRWYVKVGHKTYTGYTSLAAAQASIAPTSFTDTIADVSESKRFVNVDGKTYVKTSGNWYSLGTDPDLTTISSIVDAVHGLWSNAVAELTESNINTSAQYTIGGGGAISSISDTSHAGIANLIVSNQSNRDIWNNTVQVGQVFHFQLIDGSANYYLRKTSDATITNQPSSLINASEKIDNLNYTLTDEEAINAATFADNVRIAKINNSTFVDVDSGSGRLWIKVNDAESYQSWNGFSLVSNTDNIQGNSQTITINGWNKNWGSLENALEAAYDYGFKDGYETGYKQGYADGFEDGVSSVSP